MSRLVPALAAAALLAACEARFGNDAAPVDENASAAGRAEEGRMTVEAPGFNLSIDIPESIHADVDDQDGLVYPGSTVSGLHVQGGPERAGGDSGGEVELRFSSDDAIDRVVAWYRDPSQSQEFSIESQSREEGGFVFAGTAGRGDGRFVLRLAPRSGGGTEGRLLLSDRN